MNNRVPYYFFVCKPCCKWDFEVYHYRTLTREDLHWRVHSIVALSLLLYKCCFVKVLWDLSYRYRLDFVFENVSSLREDFLHSETFVHLGSLLVSYRDANQYTLYQVHTKSRVRVIRSFFRFSNHIFFLE